MTTAGGSVRSLWDDAVQAARLFAVDPIGLGGVVVRALPGPALDQWLNDCRKLFSDTTRFARLPSGIGDDRLLGGIDLAASLKAGKAVHERGLLADVDSGVVIIPMGERMSGSLAARLSAVLDTGVVQRERDGLSERVGSSFGVIVLDEGLESDECPPDGLCDRLAFRVSMHDIPLGQLKPFGWQDADFSDARRRLPLVTVSDTILTSFVTAAEMLGIRSTRAILFALNAARAHAAIEGRNEVCDEDAMLAARLVLAPRAVRLPQDLEEESAQDAPASPEQAAEQAPDDGDDGDDRGSDGDNDPGEPSLQDLILDATETALPSELLSNLTENKGAARGARSSGKQGAVIKSTLRGRPLGARPGTPTQGARLSVCDTLRAAAPWQRMRRGLRKDRERAGRSSSPVRDDVRVLVEKEDFRIKQRAERTETATIFVVDASGSTALHRLAEAKGAVELLLADCYVRRDFVALIAMRGKAAEVALPPTRSLTRAKRLLAALPGGGGTPMADAIDHAVLLAETARRRGQEPTIVLLTDGAANVARDGRGGRATAKADALSAARQALASGVRCLLIDTANRPTPFAAELADAMKADYVPLPRANAQDVSRVVRSMDNAGRQKATGA